MTTDSSEDYFGILGVSPDATDAEIKKAYHKLSLSLHPDKARDVEPAVAVARFQEMKLAYEVLMDPAARLAAAERQKVDRARKERRSAYEGKRKEMADELERREEEDRVKRKKQGDAQRDMQRTLEKLREEGRRLREEKERKMRQEEEGPRRGRKQEEERERIAILEEQKRQQELRESEPALGPLDLTVTVKFPSEQYDDLCRKGEGGGGLESRLAQALQVRFGPLDSLLANAPKLRKSGKMASETSAHATFKTLDAAFAAVRAGSQLRAGTPTGEAKCLQDVWIGWAAGVAKGKHGQEAGGVAQPPPQGSMPGEPARITWLRQRGLLSGQASSEASPDVKVGSNATRGDPVQSNGKAAEDDILGRMMASSKTAVNSGDDNAAPTKFSFTTSSLNSPASAPHTSQGDGGTAVDFESATLERMREAERRRVEEAIRKADEEALS